MNIEDLTQENGYHFAVGQNKETGKYHGLLYRNRPTPSGCERWRLAVSHDQGWDDEDTALEEFKKEIGASKKSDTENAAPDRESISDDMFSEAMLACHYEDDTFSAREWAELLGGIIEGLQGKSIDQIEEYIYEAPHTDDFDKLLTSIARVGWSAAESALSNAVYDRDYGKLSLLGIQREQLSGTPEGLRDLRRRMPTIYKSLEEIETVFSDVQSKIERLKSNLASIAFDLRREIGGSAKEVSEPQEGESA